MPLIRRRTREAEPSGDRLPDLRFLALVREGLEACAPGVTEGAELKGNSLISPRGWAVAVLPPHHATGHHYDVAALPDVGIQPEVPLFLDCSVAMSGNPRHAADAWVQTAGMCLLELLDPERRGRYADHAGPSDERGVPGWHAITSGVVGVGLDDAENRRLQAALLDAHVLHRIADTFAADLESPFFNGVKVFYGGTPGSMEAEVRINGERHEAASAAMTALGLPEPATFAAVRHYTLLLPPREGEPHGDTEVGTGNRIDPGTENDAEGEAESHAHGASCGCGSGCCGGELDPEHPGFEIALPHLIAELSEQEREQCVRTSTGVMIVAEGVGNFLKVRLPIRLDDGRTLVYLAWVYLEAPVIEEVAQRGHSLNLEGYRFKGLFCNAIEPWGEDLLRAPVVLQGRPASRPGAVGYCEVVESSDRLLKKVLRERWPAELVLGDRDLRKRMR